MNPFVFLLLLFSCQSDKPQLLGDQTEIDNDGDGFLFGEDCDDNDATVYPGMQEQCDSIDNDCDGLIDEDVENTYFIDLDNDGFGSEGFLFEACEPPDGYVPIGNDCDDSSPLSYPGADELCDGFDNDCDTEVDEGVLTLFYQDADADTYGNPNMTTEDCLIPDGYVENDDDCDDTNPNIYPGAAEFAGPDDCTSDQDGDGYADANAPDGVISGDDCDDTNPDVHPDAVEICDGIDNDCDGLIDDDDPDIDYSLGSLTLYPDHDGDGFGDPNAMSNELLTACAPIDGYVDDNTDCDDTPITGAVIYPGAPETCDFVDNDCDTVIDAPDTVAFFPIGSPVATDLTAQFTGGLSQAATPTLSSPGMLSICEGTYYINLTIEADILIEPVGEVILDGADQGSVILIDDTNISVDIHDLTIQNGYGSLGTSLNATNNGGGIACQGLGSSIALNALSIENCAGDIGGAIFLGMCDAIFDGVTFHGNQADWGGGVYAENAIISGNSVLFSDNQAISYGGALYSGISGELQMTDTLWDSNTAGYGGAISLWQVNTNLLTTTFINNQADIGGAVIHSNSDLVITDALFTGNIASTFGGALRLGGLLSTDLTTSQFTDVDLIDNQALYGGAVAASEGTHAFTNSFIEGNLASFGGAMLLGDQSSDTQSNLSLNLTIAETIVHSNSSPLGSAAYVRWGAILNCTGYGGDSGFWLNNAPTSGGTGAVHLLTGGYLNAEICNFGDGTQTNTPVDIYLEQGTTQLTENFGDYESLYCTGLDCFPN